MVLAASRTATSPSGTATADRPASRASPDTTRPRRAEQPGSHSWTGGSAHFAAQGTRTDPRGHQRGSGLEQVRLRSGFAARCPVRSSVRNSGRSAVRIDPSLGRPLQKRLSSSYSFQAISILSSWIQPGARPIASLHRVPVYAVVMTITKLVSRPVLGQAHPGGLARRMPEASGGAGAWVRARVQPCVPRLPGLRMWEPRRAASLRGAAVGCAFRRRPGSWAIGHASRSEARCALQVQPGDGDIPWWRR